MNDGGEAWVEALWFSRVAARSGARWWSGGGWPRLWCPAGAETGWSCSGCGRARSGPGWAPAFGGGWPWSRLLRRWCRLPTWAEFHGCCVQWRWRPSSDPRRRPQVRLQGLRLGLSTLAAARWSGRRVIPAMTASSSSSEALSKGTSSSLDRGRSDQGRMWRLLT